MKAGEAMINRSEREASIYVEFIQNYINESLSLFHEKCSKDIEYALSKVKLNTLTKRELNQIVSSLIVQPYSAFIEKFTNDINNRLCDYFHPEQDEFSPQSGIFDIYGHHIDFIVLKEFYNTEIISDVAEKLINKTLDFTCLDKIHNSAVKKFVDPLSIGGLFLSSLGLDSSLHRDRQRQQIYKVFKGISKNINIRTKKILIRQYSEIIYNMAEQSQQISLFQQAI
jgi:hypothetical protein